MNSLVLFGVVILSEGYGGTYSELTIKYYAIYSLKQFEVCFITSRTC